MKQVTGGTKKTKMKTEKKKPTIGTRKPFWDGLSRVSNSSYRENYDSIFKQRKNTK